MKISKIISCILAVILAFGALQVAAFAESEETCTHSENEVTYEFDADLTDEEKAKIIARIEGEEEPGVESRGLFCDIFAHKLSDIYTVTRVVHKVHSSAPRCVEETYKYQECTRCDDYYLESPVLSETRIYCCA